MMRTSHILTKDIMASLPLVASVLGQRYGVKVSIGGSTAFTDGTTIHLPALPLDGDAELLALARGFVDHESAHIRFTDFATLKVARLTPMQKYLWNALEDWRVENKLAALFPGCRQHFNWLIQHHFGKTFSEDHTAKAGTNPAFAVLNHILLTVRTWDVPSIAARRDRETTEVEAAWPGLCAELDTILNRVRQHCRSTQEAIGYALELSAVIEAYLKAMPSPATPAGTGKREKQVNRGNKTEASGQGSHEEINACTDSVCEPEESSPSDRLSDSQAQTGERDARQPLRNLLLATADELPRLVGEELASTLNSRQAPSSHMGLTVAETGIKHTFYLVDSLLEATLRNSVALRTRLHGLLQANVQQPCVTGRRGRLHNQRLHALAAHNPRVFLRRGERRQVSTAVHLLLDCSGSMAGSRMELASSACYTVAKALEHCRGVNVGITAFPAHGHRTDALVAPLVRHGERVHTRLRVQACGYTPLAESLWWVMQQMIPLKEERRIILILTDGMPDSVPAAEHALRHAKVQGFEVMGLGIQDNNMAQLLPKTSRTIHELGELAPAMFAMLQKALLDCPGGRP